MEVYNINGKRFDSYQIAGCILEGISARLSRRRDSSKEESYHRKTRVKLFGFFHHLLEKFLISFFSESRNFSQVLL